MVKFTDQELLEELKIYYVKTNTIPLQTDCKKATTYRRRFGSWNNALKLANIPVRQEKLEPILVDCKNCGKSVLKTVAQYEKYENSFCSRACNIKYNNAKRMIKHFCEHCGKEFLYTGGKRFCSRDCKLNFYVENNFNTLTPNTLRDYLIRIRTDKCEQCGINEWQSKKITVEMHHIDGNWKNNVLDNLKLLCPNCHSQTENYRIGNLGNGRPRKAT